MHLVQMSIFSLNNVIVALTKIMNNLLEHLKILIFKVFQCLKLVEYFKKNLWRILDKENNFYFKYFMKILIFKVNYL